MKTISILLFTLFIHVQGLTELIIILGNNNPNIQNQRIETTIQYLKHENPNKKKILYLSGGIKKYFLRSVKQMKGNTESSLMYNELNKQMKNFKDINVIMDEESTNSAENFAYLKKWVQENYPLHDFTYTIISSDFHKNRSEKLFNGIFPIIQPKFVLSVSDCIHCWNDELIHLKNLRSDIEKAQILLN